MIFMEKQSKILIVMLVVLVICIAVFWFQFNNNVATFMIVNETEVSEGGSFSGMLIDSYGNGVPNQTVTYHKPGYAMGTIVDEITDEHGEFTIDNAEYLADEGNENYYGNFTFAGNGKYVGCTYDGNVTVNPN